MGDRRGELFREGMHGPSTGAFGDNEEFGFGPACNEGEVSSVTNATEADGNCPFLGFSTTGCNGALFGFTNGTVDGPGGIHMNGAISGGAGGMDGGMIAGGKRGNGGGSGAFGGTPGTCGTLETTGKGAWDGARREIGPETEFEAGADGDGEGGYRNSYRADKSLPGSRVKTGVEPAENPEFNSEESERSGPSEDRAGGRGFLESVVCKAVTSTAESNVMIARPCDLPVVASIANSTSITAFGDFESACAQRRRSSSSEVHHDRLDIANMNWLI